uniref:Coatomer subunit beta n=1 Tax=Calcidiscus leptoporus TaxID=127549 RepID=A0A7S0NXF0_9EUKA|mmetsp:Transcript_32656/g.76145  ORF Transcript_32656/g.76145 Transcript_32656/m.76145 type:complete len:956 (+) Transcript_32656:137-3004(+)
MAAAERNCTLLLHYDKSTPPNEEEIREELEAKETEKKCEGMKTLISLQLNGEMMPKLLMTVIRFVVPENDHKLKKLLLLYWEVVDKTGPDGKLLPEMILVCNNLRNDLSHPNEYIRGCTLRFLCKLKEPEILEPLIPTIKSNLEHRHSFVRRNAVLAVFSIFKSFDFLMPDGPELVEKVLLNESDASCKRNAFLMLFHTAQDRAVAFLTDNLDQVAGYGDILQLVILELIRKVVRSNPYEKSKYIRCILTLFNSQSNAVVYECASALVALSSSATAIRAAANSYTQLLASQSDNNIKLIVLERLQELKRQHPKVLQEMIMDIMRVLNSPNLDIRKKTLDIMTDLLVPKNIVEVMQVLKKEIAKTQGEEGDKNSEYRAMLIKAIHSAAIQFPDSAASVVPVLMDFMGDPNQSSAVEVSLFVREMLEAYPQLRGSIMKKLLNIFGAIHSSRVARVALWLLGEYCTEAEEVASAFTTLKASLGELPFLPDSAGEGGASVAPQPRAEGRPVVLPDGSYASQMAVDEGSAGEPGSPRLRGLLLGGDFFLATVLATTLAKLAMRSRAHLPAVAANMIAADVVLLLTGLLQLGKAGQSAQSIDSDSQERITAYLQLLSNPGPDVQQLLLVHCRQAFSAMLTEQRAAEAADKPAADATPEVARQADDLISVRQLRGRAVEAAALDLDDDDDIGLGAATGAFPAELDFSARLKRVTQLTGLSDPVYAEAYVLVHSYDIMLDVLVINQTAAPMHNLCLELATVGDLKLCERPQSYTLAPGENKHIKANIKVSSTETGIVFGSIVYDAQGGASPPPAAAASPHGLVAPPERHCVVLHDIHIDIMDYIAPASCTDLAFRAMWAEFEWENKVAVNTDITDVKAFLKHVISSTNMRGLTPEAALDGDSAFLAANLYAKSIFGEDALVNVSVERRADGKLCGYIRIRSKTQGIALSLGDKITLKQKGPAP